VRTLSLNPDRWRRPPLACARVGEPRRAQAIASAWFLSADLSVTALYACDGRNNMTGLCDPALGDVLKASDRTPTCAPKVGRSRPQRFVIIRSSGTGPRTSPERKPLLDAVHAGLAEAALTLPIYYNVIPEVLSTRVGHYRGSGSNFGSFWNLWEWTLGN